ncbi:unnamed protein product [Gongylonema pulchrum]|uniref:Protein kinase domain-containing protein n=1 Tax=Gongylonema pulchrum TaxID=637853 RepID=A0A183DPH6_9BILA|nr:unnamed protein product [Gongylonema pulchrum]
MALSRVPGFSEEDEYIPVRRVSPENTNFPRGYSQLALYDRLPYGVVYKGAENRTGKIVTVKKYCRGVRRRKHSVPEIREASLLKELKHPNIVVLNATILDGNFIFMIFEDFPTNLKKYMMSLAEDQLVDRSQQKSFLYQMLQGVSFCHRRGVSHFDLRPENLILDGKGTLKLANFSLVYADGTPMRDNDFKTVYKFPEELEKSLRDRTVNPVWYMSPEEMLFVDYCPKKADIWSCGCVFAEMATKDPLFSGNSKCEQLDQIFRTISSPVKGKAPTPEVYQFFHHRSDSTLESEFEKYIDPSGLTMLLKMLDYDPQKRPSAKTLLSNAYFSNLDLNKFPSGSYGLRRSRSSLP